MIGDALTSLVPQAKWRLEGVDYASIEWFSEDIEKPTQEAINAEITRLQAEQETKKQMQIDARQSALNKLMALGLTEDEAVALGVRT
jgi:hypothetical protein